MKLGLGSLVKRTWLWFTSDESEAFGAKQEKRFKHKAELFRLESRFTGEVYGIPSLYLRYVLKLIRLPP